VSGSKSESVCVWERVRVSLFSIDTFGASVARAAIEMCETERPRERMSE